MFGRKGHGDVKKSAVKVLDPKKDTVTRLKHLKVVLDTYDIADSKAFFEQNYSYIYYIFYDVFTNVESDLKQRANKTHREELDFVLFIFEKILTLLPELIHKRWQYHSIGRVMKKMLHPGNSLKVRREGMRLFIVWYQILMDNAMKECHDTYRCLVPKLGNTDTSQTDIFTVKNAVNSKRKVCAVEITPLLLPQSGDKQPENMTKYMLESLLTFMVSEVNKIEWPNHKMPEFSFNFLFNKFKEFYLGNIFPDLRETNIYSPCLDLPEARNLDQVDGVNSGTSALCQEAVVKWIANFTHTVQRRNSTLQARPDNKLPASLDLQADSTVDADDQTDPAEPPVPGSNASTLSHVSSYTERDSGASSVCSDDHSISEYEIVKRILYSNRANINMVHEVFRQAFLFPFHHGGAGAVRRVIAVYKEWLQDETRPVFMQEPGEESVSNTDSPSKANPSSPEATQAGLQQVLQVFITNSANVFLLESPVDAKPGRESQAQYVDMCKRVLNIYRYMVMNHSLSLGTWEQLLLVLLRITSGVLSTTPPMYKEKSLSGRLAQPIFQTLIVTWIKANLNVQVSQSLWDHFLNVLSSLTAWVELIREWAKTMDTLTRVLARQVYNLDLNDLPLDRLSEQKEKRGRRGVKPPSQGSPRIRKRTFSRGWSRHDAVESLKAQLNQAAGMAQRTPGILIAEMGGRQRSRSGETSPLHQSSNHLSVGTQDNLGPSEKPLVRSNSDSSLFIPDPADKRADTHRTHSEVLPPKSPDIEDGTSGDELASPPDYLVNSRKESTATILSESGFGYLRLEDAPVNHGLTSIAERLSTEGKEEDGVFHDRATEPPGLGSVSTVTGDTVSVASVESGVPYQILDQSQEEGNDDISDKDLTLRASDWSTSSYNGFNNNDLSGETDSLSANSMAREGSAERDTDSLSELKKSVFKDSPTPDRESLQMDDVDAALQTTPDNAQVSQSSKNNLSDSRSVLAGGYLLGWTPDVAVVLWRRMLGALGNVNQIRDPSMHAHVYEYFCDLMEILLKIRDNLAVTRDNQSSFPPPEYLPPQLMLTPWWFEALDLGPDYQAGHLLACRLLCMAVRCRGYNIPSAMQPYLLRFYRTLHYGLVHGNQEQINVLIRHCGSNFFSKPLPGATILVLDFVHAANTIASATSLKTAPRAEALGLLGSLLCLPDHMGPSPCLQPSAQDMDIMMCSDLKDHVVNILLKSGRKEINPTARCIAISSLAIYLYEELSHDIQHCKIKEAVGVLLATLRFSNKNVAMVSSNMLALLGDHVNNLLNKHPDLPRRIIEEIAATILTLLPSTEYSDSEEDKKLLVSLMNCLLEWCMKVPLEMLLEVPAAGQKTLLFKVFRVLNMVVLGSTSSLSARSTSPHQNAELSVDNDAATGSSQSMPSTPQSLPHPDLLKADAMRVIPPRKGSPRRQRTPSPRRNLRDNYTIKLTARTVLSHLVNHLGHFPMGAGPAQLYTAVKETHDQNMNDESDDLSPEIFNQPNVQFFVLNNSAIVSCVEIPALMDMPGGGVTAGLTTGRTITRIIVRDPAGKFCWDNSVLYGPPKCRAGSFPAEPTYNLPEDLDLIGQDKAEPDSNSANEEPCEADPGSVSGVNRISSHLQIPHFSQSKQDADNLNNMLQYIGHTSPECLLKPGEPLNIPAKAPDDLPDTTQTVAMEMLCLQKDDELQYYAAHKRDSSLVARRLPPMEDRDTTSPFQLCRLFLNQLGFTQWEKRSQFDLLIKTDKLLREIKHLDNQKGRDTHKVAVIYVGPGQEDKVSVLNNVKGSTLYENFVAGLGWEVDLEMHTGFLGGLQSANKSNGSSAPYYATSTKEVLFHVATRMPAENDEDRMRKLRHLGNDEIQVVWSEHKRDYRRGIIPTDFGDVLIIIYPLSNGLFRIHIDRKPEVPFFGPLFDGAMVDRHILPGLVRATAINASSALRMLKPYYRSFYEDRAYNLENIVLHHKQPTTFEDFSAQVFAP
ncbi:hypothetical protein CAPTEDRAFT_167900, partial [Capitella teleta]